MKNFVATLLILFGLCFTLPAVASVDLPEWNPAVDCDTCSVIAIDGIDTTLTTYDASNYQVMLGFGFPGSIVPGVVGPAPIAAAPFEVGWRSLDIS